MKRYKKHIFLALSIVFFTLACNKEDQQKKETFNFTDTQKFKENSIQVENTQNKTISFYFKINNKFPLTTKDHLDSIIKMTQKKDLDTLVAAWQYVVNSNFHTQPISQSKWLHHPSIFSNSLASGYCDDQATFLVHLLIDLGYKARLMELGGHVVAEVYQKGKWKLFDPDQRVFFLNRKGEISSLQEIETDSFSINHNSTSYPSIFDFNNKISQNYLTYYLSSENNKPNDEWALKTTFEDSIYSTPSFSIFNLYYDTIQDLNLASISFSNESKGLLNIPLAPFCIEGEIKYKQKDRIFILNSKTLSSFINTYSSIEIIATSADAKIDYLVNPYLNVFKADNSIEIFASAPFALNHKKPSTSNCSSYLDVWKFEKKWDDLQEKELINYYKSIDTLNFKPINLESEFLLFSSFYPNKESSQSLLDFKQEIIEKASLEEAMFNQLLVDYYPISTSLLFTCLIEKEKAYFIQKIKEL